MKKLENPTYPWYDEGYRERVFENLKKACKELADGKIEYPSAIPVYMYSIDKSMI